MFCYISYPSLLLENVVLSCHAGMEGEIPGVWEDAAVEQPKTVFGYGFEQSLGHSRCFFDVSLIGGVC